MPPLFCVWQAVQIHSTKGAYGAAYTSSGGVASSVGAEAWPENCSYEELPAVEGRLSGSKGEYEPPANGSKGEYQGGCEESRVAAGEGGKSLRLAHRRRLATRLQSQLSSSTL